MPGGQAGNGTIPKRVKTVLGDVEGKKNCSIFPSWGERRRNEINLYMFDEFFFDGSVPK